MKKSTSVLAVLLYILAFPFIVVLKAMTHQR